MNMYDFMKKYNGKTIDFDKILGPQCTDLVKYWASENGWPIPNGNGRNALGYQFFTDGYRFIKNTLKGVPRVGDIMVWKLGNYGHVDVFLQGDWLNCQCFSQCLPRATILDGNNKLVKAGSPCSVVSHPLYRGVIGWLRKI